jgi:sugar-phosphatase
VALARLRARALPAPPLLVPADEIARGKPDPEGYLTAARRRGGDPAAGGGRADAPAGREAARRAGMRTVALATTHDATALAGADLLVPSLAGLRVAIADPGGDRPRFTLAAAVESAVPPSGA